MKTVLVGIGIAAIAVGIFVLGVYNPNPATQDICDPSYPDICIPPYPPAVKCSDVEFSNFRVYQPDPHGLDPDMNGVGCE